MTIRVHRPEALEWRRMGDIPMGWVRDHIEPTELDGHLCFHEPGSETAPQLMQMRLDLQTLIAPHSQDEDEIYYVADDSLHWEGRTLAAGGWLFISAGTTYSFRTGPDATRLLNFRARVDHSFRPTQVETRP